MASATKEFKAYQDAPASSPLYQNSQIGPVGQFEYDALNDALNTVSWLWPGPGQNEHPNEGTPAAGFRVPCIIVSPWTAGGWVCSEPSDHTSNLMFMEKITGVQAPNVSAWRRQTFGDFTSAFRFEGKPAAPPAMPDTTGDLYRSEYEVASLPAPTAPVANQVPPVQAPGRRPVIPPGTHG